MRSKLFLLFCLVFLASSVFAQPVPTNEYYFNESSSPLLDYGSNGNDGVWNGITSGVSGISKNSGEWHDGLAYSFDGSNDYIDLGDNIYDSLYSSSSDSLTISAWFKDIDSSSDSVGRKHIFSAEAAWSLNVDYNNDEANLRGWVTGGASDSVVSSTNVNDGNWHHAVISFDGDNQTLYLDGDQVDSQAGVSMYDISSLDRKTTIGGNYDLVTSEFLNGSVDEVKVYYDTHLNGSQVQELYSNNSLGSSSNAAPTAGFSFSPSSPDVSESVSFNGSSSSDPENNITKYEWDWTSDGNYEATGETQSHSYSSSGSYDVTLKVTDGAGNTDTNTKTVYVIDNVIVDGFEDGNISEYGGDKSAFNIQSTTVKKGDDALKGVPDGSVVTTVGSTSGLDNYLDQNEKTEFYVYGEGGNPRGGLVFAAQGENVDSSGAYVCVIRIGNDDAGCFKFDAEDSYTTLNSYSTTDSPSASLSTGEWYRGEVTWYYNNNITFKVFDSQDNLLITEKSTDSTYNDGGLGWFVRDSSSDTVYLDSNEPKGVNLELNQPTLKTYFEGEAPLNVSTGKNANVTYNIDGGSNTTLYSDSTQGSTNLSLSTGDKTLNVFAEKADNSSVTESISQDFSVDEGLVQEIASGADNIPTHHQNHPHTVSAESENLTFAAYQGKNINPYANVYNHSTNSWSSKVKIGDNPLTADNHGAPAIERTSDGFLHVFYGAHNDPFQYARSSNPDSISSWNNKTSSFPNDELTYPRPHSIGSDLYVMARYTTGVNNQKPLVVYNSTDSGDSWSGRKELVDFGAGYWIYQDGSEVVGDEIHFTWRPNDDDSGNDVKRNVYHAIYNTSDQTLYCKGSEKIDGVINQTTADNKCKVYDSGTTDIGVTRLEIDENGNPHVLWNNGGAGGTNTDVLYSKWTGSSWSSPDNITTLATWANRPEMVLHNSTDIDVYASDNEDGDRAGSLQKWNYNGSSWSKEVTLAYESNAASTSNGYNQPVQTRRFFDDVRLIFAEHDQPNYGENDLTVYSYDDGTEELSEDTTAPSITIDSPQNQTYSSSSVDLNVTSSETVNFTYNNGAGNVTVDENDQDLNESLSGLSQGTYTVDVWATDSADNTGHESVSYSVITDPQAEFTANETTLDINETVEFDTSGSTDDGSISSYDWSFGDSSTGTGEIVTHSYSSTGSYTVDLTVTDNDGNTDTASKTVDVVNKSATKTGAIESCSSDGTPFCTNDTNPVNKGTVQPGETIEASWEIKATGAASTYETFAIFESDNPFVETVNSQVLNVSIVSDGTAETNSPPTADFSTSTTDLTVDVDASGSSDGDGTITNYEWDWTNDGSYESTGETSSHSYGSNGTYTIKLRVTDNNGSTDTATKDVSVSSSTDSGDDTDDGGGGSGGGGSDGGDSTNDTTESTSVNGTTASLHAPHFKARYYGDTFNITEGDSYTDVFEGLEQTFEVTKVYDNSNADIRVNGNEDNYNENDLIEIDGDEFYVTDVVDRGDNGNGTVVLSYKDFSISNPDVYFEHNYSINDSGSIELLYRKTGASSWNVLDTVSSSSSVNETFVNTTKSLSKSTYEAALRVNKSGQSNLTNPTGFYVGQVPDITVLRPEDSSTYWTVKGAGNTEVPLDYKVETFENGSTELGQYYQDTNGNKYLEFDVEERRVVGDSDGFLEDIVEAYEVSWYNDLFPGLGTLFEFLQIDAEETLYQNTTAVSISDAGVYTGYANYTDNTTSYTFTGTSIGQTVTVKQTSPGDENYEDEYVPQRDEDQEHSLNRTNVSERQINSSLDGNSTDTDYYYNAWLDMFEPDPGQTFVLADMETSSITLDFDFVANSTAPVNKTIFVTVDNGSTVYNESLDPVRSKYKIDVNGSQLEEGEWEENDYTVYGRTYYSNGSTIETVKQTDYSFKVRPAGLKDLVSRWLDPIVEGLTTVYDVTSERAGFLIALVVTIGWYLGFKARQQDFIGKAGAVLWFAGFWWYGYIPGEVQALVLGTLAIIFTKKLLEGEVTL